MKVLVLGGTGAMGIHIVNILAKNGNQIFITSRKRNIDKSNITYFRGNAKDMNFIEPILKQKLWDVIIDFMIYDVPSFEERVGLMLSSTKQYIYLSSSRVYADSVTKLTENSSRLLDICKDHVYLQTDEYALTKARQENILKNYKRNNWTIIRPYITYSENRLQLGTLEKEDWLYRALKGRTIIFSKDINSRLTTMTYGYDVAKAIVAIMGKENALGEAFHVTHNDAYKWKDILDIYLKTLEKYTGIQPKFLLCEKTDFFKIRPNKYQVEYDRLFNRNFDNTKIGNYVDLKSFTDLESGIGKCLKYLIEHQKFLNINWKKEAIMDRLSGEWTNLKEISKIKSKVKYLLYRFGFLR